MSNVAQRVKTISEICVRVGERLDEIEELVEAFPVECDLGTWKALDTATHRCLLDVRDYTERAIKRLEARRGGD